MLNEGYGLGKIAWSGKEGWDFKLFEGCDI